MASAKNDALLDRTVEGSLNYYDNHRGCGTATDKGLAARLGGHSYNILNNTDKHEIYFRNMRHDEHFVDGQNRHTKHFVGPRRRKGATNGSGHVAQCIQMPDPHPRHEIMAQRREATQLAQQMDSASYSGFLKRRNEAPVTTITAPPFSAKQYSIDSKLYANEAGKLRPAFAGKADFLQRRGEKMQMSASCPSLSVTDPAGGLGRAARDDIRKEAHQRQTESAHFAHTMSANTLVRSMDVSRQGQDLNSGQRHCSVNRVENHDFAVSRKNNHFSSQDKLTRADPFYMRPRLGVTNNSVKYDILSNERRWFKYG